MGSFDAKGCRVDLGIQKPTVLRVLPTLYLRGHNPLFCRVWGHREGLGLSVSTLRLRVFAVPPRHRRLARGVVSKGGDRAGQVGVGHHLGKDLQHVDERPSGLELLKEPRGNHAVVIEDAPAEPEHEPAAVVGNAVSTNHESSLFRARPPNRQI